MKATTLCTVMIWVTSSVTFGNWSVSDSDKSDTIFRSVGGATYNQKICNKRPDAANVCVTYNSGTAMSYDECLDSGDSITINQPNCTMVKIKQKATGATSSGSEVEPTMGVCPAC